MDENQQDKTESKQTADKLSPPPLSTKDHRGADRPQNSRMGAITKRLGFFGYDKEMKEYTPDGQLAKITKEHQPGKTLWDWLQLVGMLLIPLPSHPQRGEPQGRRPHKSYPQLCQPERGNHA